MKNEAIQTDATLYGHICNIAITSMTFFLPLFPFISILFRCNGLTRIPSLKLLLGGSGREGVSELGRRVGSGVGVLGRRDLLIRVMKEIHVQVHFKETRMQARMEG
jgi:hypothetical protein